MQPEDAEEYAAEKGGRRSASGKARRSRGLAAVFLSVDQKLEIGTAEVEAIKREVKQYSAFATGNLEALKVSSWRVYALAPRRLSWQRLN